MKVHVEVGVEPDWWPLEPGAPGRMVGGRERLAIELAQGLAARGHEVSFRGGDCRGGVAAVEVIGTIHALPRVDACVCVDCDPPDDVAARSWIAYSHAAQWPVSGAAHDAYDAVVAVSNYHAALLRRRLDHPRIVPIPAGTVVRPDTVARDRFLYASSPDRGLHRLLAVWPALWSEFRTPLSIAYDLRGVLARRGGHATLLGERLRALVPMLDQEGIIVHGPLDPAALQALQARSRALLYPLDPILPHSELYALSVLDACAAGCPPVLAPVDCFPSEYGGVARLVEPKEATWEPDAWVSAVGNVLDEHDARAAACRDFASRRTWDGFTGAWEALLAECSMLPRPSPPRGAGGQSWLVAVGGLGIGEANLAAWLARAAVAQGHRVHVVVNLQHLAPVVAGPWAVEVDPGLGGIVQNAAAGFDRVVLCSALTCAPVLPGLAALPACPPVASLETGWPDTLPRWPGHEVVDTVLVPLPPATWMAGLAAQGGPFALPPSVSARCRPVGWLPEALQRPGRSPGEPPRVLLYLGVRPAPWLHALAPALGEALEYLRERRGIVARYLVLDDPLDLPPWVERVGLLAPTHFERAVAECDLVVCHVGLGTVSVARAAGVPVLVLAEGNIFGSADRAEGDRVAAALFASGEVELSLGVPPAQTLADRMEAALSAAAPTSCGGAERAVTAIAGLVRSAPSAGWFPPELVP